MLQNVCIQKMLKITKLLQNVYQCEQKKELQMKIFADIYTIVAFKLAFGARLL